MRAWKLEYLSSLAHREWWQENGDAVWKAFLLYVCVEADILIGWDVLLYIFVMILNLISNLQLKILYICDKSHILLRNHLKCH